MQRYSSSPTVAHQSFKTSHAHSPHSSAPSYSLTPHSTNTELARKTPFLAMRRRDSSSSVSTALRATQSAFANHYCPTATSTTLASASRPMTTKPSPAKPSQSYAPATAMLRSTHPKSSANTANSAAPWSPNSNTKLAPSAPRPFATSP